MSLERAAERCINVLLELIQTKVTYVVQEAVVVIKDIFRRYPNRCVTRHPVEASDCKRKDPEIVKRSRHEGVILII